MSKSILIIDTPENCEDCPLFRTSQDFNATIHYCMPYQCKELFMVKEKGISENCPLKPMPKELEPAISEEYVNYCQGFNDCLNEILGNGNETNI